MGKTTTPTYRINYFTLQDGPTLTHTLNWPKGMKVSNAALADVVKTYNKSFLPGECNAHIGPLTITAAVVIHQLTGREVASYLRGE